MRYNYCPRCNKAFVKSRVDQDNCIYCSGKAEPVNVKRSGLYFLGYGIMMAGAICVFLPRLMVLEGPTFYYVIGVSMAVAGSVLVIVASTRMAKNAVKTISERMKSEDAQ
ncbi:MAG: hypothetical protein Q7J68_00870 [Thermoplasmata archaeon]|nr:hypothetical protein [Thermoplasmata archaeon]